MAVHRFEQWIGITAWIVLLGVSTLACGSRPDYQGSRAHDQASRPDYQAILDEGADHHAEPPVTDATAVRLPKCVNTPVGCLDLEDVYIAGVVECELGGLTDSAAALEAQAIAARTFVTRYLHKRGFDTVVRITPHFQCWRRPRKARSVKVARATAGNVMLWNGKLIIANYVAGTRKLDDECRPMPPSASGYPFANWAEALIEKKKRRGPPAGVRGTDWTEIYVTYNEGRFGEQVTQSPIAGKVSKNRGALSQNVSKCLGEKRGYETREILKYFYGDDIILSRPLPYERDS